MQSLLDPNEKKSFFDYLTLATLAIEIGLLFLLPRHVSQYFFLVLFLFWRSAYNIGLGYLLKYQSNSRSLVHFAEKYKLFDLKKNPKVASWLKEQLSMKMDQHYDFEVYIYSDKKKYIS